MLLGPWTEKYYRVSSAADYRLDGDAKFAGSDHPQYGKLVFSHHTDTGAPFEFFARGTTEAVSCTWNSLDRAPHKFSRFADLEQLRAADGSLHFTLVYPNLPAGVAVMRWKQFRCVDDNYHCIRLIDAGGVE